MGEGKLLQRVFHLDENKTTVRRELLAGLTTFMTMAYVVVVNPRILSEAGHAGGRSAVCDVHFGGAGDAGDGVVGELSDRAGAGHVAERVLHLFDRAWGAECRGRRRWAWCFLSGLLFLLLTLTNVREHIVNGIPDCLKHGTAGGIGLFIAFVGLRNAKIIVANPATFVAFGKTSDPQVLLAAAGLILIAILMVRRVGSAILLGIVAITHRGNPGGGELTGQRSFFRWPHPSGTFLKLDLRSATKLGLGELIFVFFFVDLVRQRRHVGGRVRAGRLSCATENCRGRAARCWRMRSARLSGALTGTSTVTSYIESAAGVAAGARTGLGNLVIAGLFLRGDVLRASGGGDSRRMRRRRR